MDSALLTIRGQESPRLAPHETALIDAPGKVPVVRTILWSVVWGFSLNPIYLPWAAAEQPFPDAAWFAWAAVVSSLMLAATRAWSGLRGAPEARLVVTSYRLYVYHGTMRTAYERSLIADLRCSFDGRLA